MQNDQQQRQENEPEITNAAHAARTAELRAMAANIRERDISSRELTSWFFTSRGRSTVATSSWGTVHGLEFK